MVSLDSVDKQVNALYNESGLLLTIIFAVRQYQDAFCVVVLPFFRVGNTQQQHQRFVSEMRCEVCMKTFVIKVILNNNAVLATEGNSQKRYIILEKGLGFGHKKGDVISETKNTRVFVCESDEFKNKLLSIMDEVPIECIVLSEQIVTMIESSLGKKMNYSLLFNLADHINFTVQRYNRNLVTPSLIDEEIKVFYPQEYVLGKQAVEIIEDHYNMQICGDEAAAIAFHIINASEEINMMQTRKLVMGVNDIVNITKESLQIEMQEDSLAYSRFIIHLKFFLKGILMGKTTNSNNNSFLYKLLSETNAPIKDCLKEISSYTVREFRYSLTKDDRTYLTIHLLRLLENQEN